MTTHRTLANKSRPANNHHHCPLTDCTWPSVEGSTIQECLKTGEDCIVGIDPHRIQSFHPRPNASPPLTGPREGGLTAATYETEPRFIFISTKPCQIDHERFSIKTAPRRKAQIDSNTTPTKQMGCRRAINQEAKGIHHRATPPKAICSIVVARGQMCRNRRPRPTHGRKLSTAGCHILRCHLTTVSSTSPSARHIARGPHGEEHTTLSLLLFSISLYCSVSVASPHPPSDGTSHTCKSN